MARYYQSVDNVASGTAKLTLLQLATPTTRRLIVTEFEISFLGTSSNTPVLVTLERQTTAGTATSGTGGIVKADPSDVASVVTSQYAFSAQPTSSDALRVFRISPTAGIALQFPLGREPKIAASSYIGITVLAGTTVPVSCGIEWEEV